MSLAFHDFRVRDWGYLVLLIPGVWGMFYAFTADVFLDGSSTPMTEEHIEKLGMKATPLTRSIVFALALLMTVFAVWKMFKP
ncbi:MAG: hypothetical protein ACLPY1_01685 [Terracidiphilus sp.]